MVVILPAFASAAAEGAEQRPERREVEIDDRALLPAAHERQAAAGGRGGEEAGLGVGEPERLQLPGRVAGVGEEHRGRGALEDRASGAALSDVADALGQHDERGVLLAHRQHPVLQTRLEVRVVEQLPGLVEHDERGPAVLHGALDATEDVGEPGGAHGRAVEDLREVEGGDAVGEVQRIGPRAGEEPVVLTLLVPARHARVQIAPRHPPRRAGRGSAPASGARGRRRRWRAPPPPAPPAGGA